jgi:hypothetical protein
LTANHERLVRFKHPNESASQLWMIRQIEFNAHRDRNTSRMALLNRICRKYAFATALFLYTSHVCASCCHVSTGHVTPTRRAISNELQARIRHITGKQSNQLPIQRFHLGEI